jgi:SpoU rRNA methylase family enzyme
MATDLKFVVTALDKANAVFERMAGQLDKISKKLDSIDGKVARARVEVDTDKADREIGAFATNMRKRIEAAVKSLPDIELNADSSDADRELAKIRGELKDLSGKTIGVDISAEDAKAEMDRLRGELNRLGQDSASIQVKADTAAAIAKLDEVDGKVKRLDGKSAKVKVDVDKSLSDSLIQVTRLGTALRTLALPAAVLAAAPQIASLGAAAVQAAGAIGVIPAAAGAAGLAVATAAVSFGKLATYFTADSDKKKKQAFDALSASGQNLAKTIDTLKPRFADLEHAVQDSAFKGLADQVKPLADSYLPLIKTQMVGIAGGFNQAALGVAKFLTAPSVVRDLGGAFEGMRGAVTNATKAIQPLVMAFTDIISVGSSRLPALGQGVADLATKFARFIDSARESGQLGQWMDLGIAKVQQLGQIAVNVGGTLFSIFKASSTAGADFLGTLERVTGGINNFFKSAQGQGALVALFTEIRATVDALTPGVQALAGAVADVIAKLSNAGVIHSAAEALSAMAIAVSPVVSALGTLAANVLPPVLHLLTTIAPVIGPIAAGFVAWKLAAMGMEKIQPVLDKVGSVIANTALNAGTMTEKFTGSAAAGEKVATAGSKIQGALGAAGTALPILGAGVLAITTAYEIWGSKADEAAQKVLNGSISTRQAIEQEAAQVHSNQIEWLGGMNAQESYAAAAKNVRAEIDAQRASMSPMQQLTSDVARAQADLNDAVAQYGPRSNEAQVAAANLSTARDREKAATDGVKQATQSYGDAIVEASNKAAGAANADLAYQQGLLNLKDASNQAADAARNHAAGSDEVTRADLAVQQASLSAAQAAQQKAQKDAEARGASDAAAIGAQAYKDELQRQADTLQGPAKQAALDNIALLGGQKGAEDTARTATNLYKTELQKLADHENGPTAAAIRNTITGFDNLGGAHANAEQKSAAQRAALVKLASQTTGPTHDAIMGMIHDLDSIPRQTDFTVKGVGQVSYGSPELLRAAHGGFTGGIIRMNRHGLTGVEGGYADGGVLPGYTPGRDVHTFQAANGSILRLSGGEAVMRPEWTQAVGAQYVKAANSAARQGGVGGVMDFVSRTAPRASGEGVRGDGNAFANGGIIGSFAGGGVVLTGKPFRSIPPEIYNTVAGSLVHTIQGTIEAAIKRLAAEAAAGGVAGVAGGGAQAALNWARTQVGKPYIWGAVGPRGYDCSGFMSAVLNVMQGRNPYSRRGATGNFPWAGFAPGLGGQFAIGAFRGNPGHMAGTLAPGVNVESSGGVGVRVGGGARGANNGMFNIRAHIGDRGGVVQSGTAAVNLSGRNERLMDPEQTRVFDQIRAAVTGGSVGGGGGALLDEMRRLNAQIHMLRGDVDHHGDQGAIAAGIGVTNRLLAGLATGNAAAGAQSHRVVSELGPF